MSSRKILREKLLRARDRLQQHIKALLAIADGVDKAHKEATKTKIVGGTLGIAGGITTFVGLGFLCPASLPVSAIGFGVSLFGGLTRAAATRSDSVQSQDKEKEFNKLLGQCEDEINRIKQYMEHISASMRRAKEGDWLFETTRTMAAAGRVIFNGTKMVKAGDLLGKAGHITQLAGTATRTMTGVTLGLDVLFVAKDSIELLKGAKTDLAAKIREAVTKLKEVIKQVNNKLQKMLTERRQ
ncbi:apolipoprotein L1-like [Alligator sinensis]|uniref:Apolipoprotein L1-like n=1 Tax=Alligator sinensis TaxID=38654 RepID=A0A3Q0FZV8_ALLSI|nr:apolipoprotein L1-like [Alligator sinensis]